MRNAETALNVIRERGKQGLPLGDVYRQLYNPALYLLAYSRIYANKGALTMGATQETADGMSLKRIQRIIDDLRYERYRWTPVRRANIPKKNGETRPLGIPSWSDKLLQEVIRLILEAYYEPQFAPSSHGFRPGRGCHTALQSIQQTWKGTKWFIEGDIRGCFDNIHHETLMDILRERIVDNRFLRLIHNLLKAGVMEEWRYRPTLSGVPQGGVVSPILTNIYLNKLDRFIERELIPQNTRGKVRAQNPTYQVLCKHAWYLKSKGRIEEAQALQKQYQAMPRGDPHDPQYRRLRYIRYADDFLLGFIGSHQEAEAIKAKLEVFMRETLRMELSSEKTLVTHARTQAAKFLGYEIVAQHCDCKRTEGRRTINGYIGLRMPARFVEERCAHFMRNGKPVHRPELLNESDYTIVSNYQAMYRGYVEYYRLACNVHWLSKLHWVMQVSLLKTLAAKHKSTVTKMCKRHKRRVKFPHGERTCLQVVIARDGKPPLAAHFGGLSLTRNPHATIQDGPMEIVRQPRNELLTRLLASQCELCGATQDIQVHHIRALKDLKRYGKQERPLWVQNMAARKRKTLVVCRPCHRAIHNGKHTGTLRLSEQKTERAV